MKKILLFVCAMLGIAGSTLADDRFSVDNITLPKNGEADVVVKFSLDQSSTCSGYTFWLQVPEQLAFVTYEKNGNTYVTYTAGDCYDGTPSITPNIDGGYLKVGCLTANSDPIIGQTGTLVTFRLKVIGSVNVGDVLTGTLTNGTISPQNGSVHDVANANFSITIGEPVDPRTVLDENSTTAPTAATGVDVRVKRTLAANVWNTICLPFAMDATQVEAAFGSGVELGNFTRWSSEENDVTGDIVSLNLEFTDVTSIEANHPYIIQVKSPISEFTVDGVDIDADNEPYVQVGARKAERGFFTGTYVANTTVPENNLFISGNKFWYSTGSTKTKAFRGFFELYDELTNKDNPAVKMHFNFDGETILNKMTTDNGQESKEIYDLSGRRVEKATNKGIYIINNKKILVQ